jgi:hypothetical protein
MAKSLDSPSFTQLRKNAMVSFFIDNKIIQVTRTPVAKKWDLKFKCPEQKIGILDTIPPFVLCNDCI